MAFNLPPPWDPGFALPDNVRDEGLERRGFVTKQMPRGTYDQPNVGTGGYAVPEYIMDEGYGQGTFTTKWEPRGEYDGGRIPNWLNKRPKVLAERKIKGRTRETTIAFPIAVMPYNEGSAVAMSGIDELPKPFANYGKGSAYDILSRVQSLPQDKRKVALKRIMDTLDPTLWTRTAKLARQNVAAGMSAAQALREGLALALGSGIAVEMVQAGMNGRAPKRHSLLGLGCYGPMGLGEISTLLLGPELHVQILQAPQVMCAGYTWAPAAGGIPAHWQRSRAHLGIPDQPGPAPCPTSTTGTSGTPVVTVTSSGQVVTGTQVATAPTTTVPMFQVGPWNLPDVEGQRIGYSWSVMTPEQRSSLLQALAKATAVQVGYDAMAKRTTSLTDLSSVGLGSGKVASDALSGKFPIAKFTKNGEPKQLRAWFTGTKAAPQFALAWDKNLTLGEAVWKAFYDLHAIPTQATVDFLTPIVKGAVDSVSDRGCQLAQSSVGKPAAMVVGAYYGGPTGAAAGAAGADIAKDACGKPIPQEALVPPSSAGASNLLPLALIGGGVVLAAVLLSRKKKTP